MTSVEVQQGAAPPQTDLRTYLPAPSGQVLQRPRCALQRVRIRALREQREVGFNDGGVPQHLDPFGGVRGLREGAQAVPLLTETNG